MTDKEIAGNMKPTRGITEPLQFKIDIIGRLVQQVVRQQAGPETARLIEDLMDLCESASRSDQWRTHSDLQPRIENLDLDQLVWICRAFTTFFHLVNEAERQEIIRINRLAGQKETPENPRKGSILEAVQHLKQQGLSDDAVQRLVDELDIEPTLTAHPTEVRRGTILLKQNHIAELLAHLSQDRLVSQRAMARTIDQIAHEVALLLVTDDVRPDRLRVQDEVNNGIYYQTHVIWETLRGRFPGSRPASCSSTICGPFPGFSPGPRPATTYPAGTAPARPWKNKSKKIQRPWNGCRRCGKTGPSSAR